MKIRNHRLILTAITLVLILSYGIKPAFADKFSSAYLRLNNQGANSLVDATVCAKPSTPSAGNENKVIVTFPSSFSISSAASDWTTDSSNLPDGAVAWPGISANASVVSGKSVTITSSDLTASVLYCFSLSSSTSSNGPANPETIGEITTEDLSDNIIDSTTYATSVVSSNQIAVTAWVGPHVSDLPVSIDKDRDGDVNQNTEIEYTVTYGMNTVDPFPLTIQVQWSQGTVQNSTAPSVEILNYVTDSASDAYNSTPPVIDTVNRTITWNITRFPGGITGQNITFKLRTTDNYQGENKVNFDVSARAISGSIVTPDVILSQLYQFKQSASTATPTPTLAANPTGAIAAGLEFGSIDILSLSQSTAEITISTNNNSLINFRYGKSPNTLTETIKTLSKTQTNLISLDKLTPNTDYYFRITAMDESGKSIVSDIYTFKTAVISPIPSVDTKSVIATSKDNLLINPLAPGGSNMRSNIIVIPTRSLFTIQFSLDKAVSLKTIQALIRNKKVLAFNTTETAEAAVSFVNLAEIQPGVYAGKLDSQNVGQYEIYVRLIDFNGNILEEKIADLLVTERFRVLEKGNGNAIENARVLLYIYNQTTRTYSAISPQILPIDNPSFTAPDGSLGVILPYGKYKAEVSAIGYGSESRAFEISPYTNSYPTVYLTNQGFNIFNTVGYYSEIASDAFTASQTYLRSHADSSRLFNMITTGALFTFVLITLLAFSARTHVSFWYLPYFLIYRLRVLIRKEDRLLVVGKVEDKITQLPVSKAAVYIQNPKTGHVEVTLTTNKLGEFYYEGKSDRRYQIYVMKKGYITPSPILHQNKGKQESIAVGIEKLEEAENPLIDIIIVYFEDVLGMFLEFLIVLGFIFEFYFVATFGLLRTAPFMLISSLTFILLLVYVYKPRVIKG